MDELQFKQGIQASESVRVELRPLSVRSLKVIIFEKNQPIAEVLAQIVWVQETGTFSYSRLQSSIHAIIPTTTRE